MAKAPAKKAAKKARPGTKKRIGTKKRKTPGTTTVKKTGPGGKTLAKKAAKKSARKAATKAGKKAVKTSPGSGRVSRAKGETKKGTEKPGKKATTAPAKKARTSQDPKVSKQTQAKTGPTAATKTKRTVRWSESQPPMGAVPAGNGSLTGRTMPDFSLEDQDGKTWTLAGLKGKPFVLYFYPKDDTTGCTKEACAFRDHYGAYRDRDVTVLGVSADSIASHRRFADKYNLPFPLLSDPDRRLIEALGAWREKNMYGRRYMGIQRMTVIVGPDGRIVKEYPKVSPEKHAEEILGDLSLLA